MRRSSRSGTTVKPTASGSYCTRPRDPSIVQVSRCLHRSHQASRRPHAGHSSSRRKSPLRDERGVVRRLHPLDAVDPEAVVPLLHPRDEGRHRVLCDERGRTRRDVLALRCGGNANHESCERLLLQMRVGIDRHDERRRHRCEGCVQSVVLALLRLEDASVGEAEALTRRVCEQRGVVGRVVVRDDDLDRAVVGEFSDAFERADDRRALVPRRDDDGHRRPLPFGQSPSGGSSGRSWYRVIRRVKIMNPITRAGM